jgi:hypothetical protein
VSAARGLVSCDGGVTASQVVEVGQQKTFCYTFTVCAYDAHFVKTSVVSQKVVMFSVDLYCRLVQHDSWSDDPVTFEEEVVSIEKTFPLTCTARVEGPLLDEGTRSVTW